MDTNELVDLCSLPEKRQMETSAYEEPRFPEVLTAMDEWTDGEEEIHEHAVRELTFDLQQQMLTIYDEMRPRFFGYLRSLRLQQDEIEEIIQEAFVRLTRTLQQREITNIHGWLAKVVHHLALRSLQRSQRDITRLIDLGHDLAAAVKDQASSPEQNYIEKEQMTRMEVALATLKPLHRQCFSMRSSGLSYKDIGQALGISTQRAALIVKQVAVRLAAICG